MMSNFDQLLNSFFGSKSRTNLGLLMVYFASNFIFSFKIETATKVSNMWKMGKKFKIDKDRKMFWFTSMIASRLVCMQKSYILHTNAFSMKKKPSSALWRARLYIRERALKKGQNRPVFAKRGEADADIYRRNYKTASPVSK